MNQPKLNSLGLVKQSVDQWLNQVNYGDDLTYKPSAFALAFVNFIKLVNGGSGEENTTPVLHLKMLDQIDRIDTPKIANMVFRGAAKTTVLGEYLLLYLAVFGELPTFGKINLAIYVSDSVENGVKNMRKNLEYRRENSPFLMRAIPHAKFTDIRWEFNNASGNRFIVKGYGGQTGVRGVKEMGVRPQLAIIDDVVSDEDARSQTCIDKIKDTVHNAIDHAMHPKGSKTIWSGTPFNASDPLYEAIESGSWAVNCYPVCEKFPCTEEEFKGAWENRFTYAHVRRKYEEAKNLGRLKGFNQELMLRIMSDEDRLVSEADINWYSRNDLLKNKSTYNYYITTDFATSEKQSADYSVISVWAVNYLNQFYYVDGICKRQTMDKNVEDLFGLCSKYKPLGVGVEVSGQQEGFIPWLKKEQVRRQIYFNFASSNNSNKAGIRPSVDKLQRFYVVTPWFNAGNMFFPEELQTTPILIEAMEEIRLASSNGLKSKHDDFLDTISMLGCMHIIVPSQSQELSYNTDSNLWTSSTMESSNESALKNYIV